MTRRILKTTAAACLSAVVAAAAISDVNVAGNQGPSTQSTPYLVPTAAGVRFVSILTTGETVGPKLDGVTPYVMIGLPDGMGAFDNGDGTFTLLAGHEMGSAAGVVRAHGSVGASVSAWVIDKSTLRVISGADLIRTVQNWDVANQRWNTGTTAFNRFCSADLPAVSALYNAATGKGTRERIFFGGEETSNGRAFGHIATGPNAGVAVELPRLGRDAFENVVACPFAQDKTIVAATDDTTPGQVYFYIGTKTAAGSEVQRAGLANGKLWGVIANAVRTEDRTTGVGVLKGASAPFTLADLGDASAVGYVTETTADNAGVTEWLRPEDGAWDPSNPRDFYFVTTDRFDQTKNATGAQVGRSRLWRLRFTDLATPEQGGTVTLLLDGSEAHNMFDNMCIDRQGNVMIQEDTGGVSWSARIWRYSIATGALTEVARHDSARFGNETTPATLPFSIDEESSGILDASEILGPGWFLLCDQAHGGTSQGTEIVENGQFLAMFDPATASPPVFTIAPTASPSDAVAGSVVRFSAAADAPGDGALTYAWTFGDGQVGAGAETTHTYSAPGVYVASVTATHTATGKTVQADVPVTVRRTAPAPVLSISLDFAKASRSVITLRGELPVAAGFSASGKSVTVDVGGIARTFTLDARGRGTAANGTLSVTVRKVKGQVPAQRVKFTMTLKGDTLAGSLTDEGISNADAAGVPVSVAVSTQFEGSTYESVADLIYDAKAGKRGVAR